MHFLYHFLPAWRIVACLPAETTAIEAAIDFRETFWFDLDIEIVRSFHQREKIEFADGLRCHMPYSSQIAMFLNDLRNKPGKLDRG